MIELSRVVGVLCCFCFLFSNAIYFNLDGLQKKCFIEDLAKDTVLLGILCA